MPIDFLFRLTYTKGVNSGYEFGRISLLCSYSKKVSTFTRTLIRRCIFVFRIWRPPGAGIVSTDWMLDFNNLGSIKKSVLSVDIITQ